MTPRILVSVLLSVAIAVGLGFLLLGGEERSRGEDPVSAGSDQGDADVRSAAHLTPADALDPAVMPAPEAVRRALTASAVERSNEEQSADANATTIVGRVVDEAGRPVAGATVRAVKNIAQDVWRNRSDESSLPHDTTGRDGAFRLVVGHTGDTILGVRAAGFAPATVEGVRVAAAARTELTEDIVLESSAILKGVVLDESGVAVEGALVEVREPERDPFSAMAARMTGVQVDAGMRTVADGAFAFDQLPRGSLTLQVTHDEFVEYEHPLDAAEPVQLPFFTVRLDRGTSIEGRVTGIPVDATEPLTVVGLPHQMNPRSAAIYRRAEVGADGSFRLPGLPVASGWTLFARPTEDGFGYFADVEGRVSEVVDVEAGRRNLVLPWQAASQLTFQVVDASTREPIEVLTVKHHTGWDRSIAMSDRKFADGNVRLADLRPDLKGKPMKLSVDAIGYEPWVAEDLVLVPGRDMELGTIALVPTPRATVTVLDDRDGTPVAGATVRRAVMESGARPVRASSGIRRSVTNVIATPSGGAPIFRAGSTPHFHVTDEHGQVVFDGAAGSTIGLTITAEGFAESNVTGWELPADQETERVVRLVQGGAVLVAATDAEGRALAGRTIEHRAPPGWRITTSSPFDPANEERVTDAEGRVLFANLNVGKHTFRIGPKKRESGAVLVHISGTEQPAAADTSWTAVAVAAGRTSDLALSEAPRATLTGRITERGRPLKQAQLSLRRELDDSVQGQDRLRAIALQKFPGAGGTKTRTDHDGRYSIESLEPGDYVLEISHADRALPFEFELTLGAGETRRDVDLSVAIVAGRVVGSDGRGIAGVAVAVGHAGNDGPTNAFNLVVSESGLLRVQGMATTDASGAYEIRGVTTDVELIVLADGSAVGYQSARSEPLTVAADELARDVDLTLERAGSLDLRVRRPDGTFPDFVPLELRRADAAADALSKQHFLVNGTGQVEGLAPGIWTVRARDGNSGPRAEREVEVLSGETLLVELVLPQ